MNLIESLNWRYATKKYSNQKLSEEKVQKIIDATMLTASSAGMQPYRIYVIENPELRKQLWEGSFNHQIKDASHLMVFAAFSTITQKHIDDYIHLVAKTREIPESGLNDFKKSLEGNMLSRSDDENFSWAAKQAYIALGTALVAAADLKVDASPMEGFDPLKFDKLLGLKEKGLKSVVLLALGYRDEANDIFARLKKVRISKADFVVEIK